MDLGILIDANSTEKNFLNQKYLAREILKWVPDIGQVWINTIVDKEIHSTKQVWPDNKYNCWEWNTFNQTSVTWQ